MPSYFTRLVALAAAIAPIFAAPALVPDAHLLKFLNPEATDVAEDSKCLNNISLFRWLIMTLPRLYCCLQVGHWCLRNCQSRGSCYLYILQT
jgi:hypothetical protein